MEFLVDIQANGTPRPQEDSLRDALGLRSDIHPVLLTPEHVARGLLTQVSQRPCKVEVTVTLQHVHKLTWTMLALHRIAQPKS
jgi:hypothetical protein